MSNTSNAVNIYRSLIPLLTAYLHSFGYVFNVQVVSTTGGMTVRTHMAAAGVRSSGAGLEMLPFSSPVLAVGRFELWVRDIDRQLISAIVNDVETAMAALLQRGKPGLGLGGSPLLRHVGGVTERAADSHEVGGSSAGLQMRPGVGASPSQPAAQEGQTGAAAGEKLSNRRQPSVQGQLLARSANWTTAVEAALSGTSLGTSQPPAVGSGGGGRGGEVSGITKKPEYMLQEVLSAVLRDVDGWVGELCQPGGMMAYYSLTNTALTTQALQHRDVVEELLKTVSGSTSSTPTATLGGGLASSAPAGSATRSSFLQGRAEESTGGEEASDLSPFLWMCHLRHYYTSPEDAKFHDKGPQQGNAGQDSSNNSITSHGDRGGGARSGEGGGGDEDPEQDFLPPPPPLIRVGLGPWNVPYGFEYAGTLERLWLTPLSERCLLHAVHSAKVKPLIAVTR